MVLVQKNQRIKGGEGGGGRKKSEDDGDYSVTFTKVVNSKLADPNTGNERRIPFTCLLHFFSLVLN